MAGPHPVTCPSGLAGEVRSLKSREANMLAESAGKTADVVFDDLLRQCWSKTTNAGIYVLGEDASMNWTKALVGDRFAAILALRTATYGPVYEFRVQCTNKRCQDQFAWEINLDTDIFIKPLPEASKQALRTGKLLEGTQPDGTQFKFRLITGEDEQRAVAADRKKKRRDNVDDDGPGLFTKGLLMRLVSVDGVQPEDLTSYVDDLDLDVVMAMVSEMDDADCGVDTTLNVKCPDCRTVQELQLPLAKEFWLPSRKSSKRAAGDASKNSSTDSRPSSPSSTPTPSTAASSD